jgi:hypothetical protein
LADYFARDGDEVFGPMQFAEGIRYLNRKINTLEDFEHRQNRESEEQKQ